MSRLLFVFRVMGPRARGPRQIRGAGLKGPAPPARAGPLEGGGEQMQGSHCEARALGRAGCPCPVKTEAEQSVRCEPADGLTLSGPGAGRKKLDLPI